MDVNQKQAAKKFVERWKAEEGNEDRQSRSFWIEFAQDLLGINNPTHVLDFERKVKGRKIDVFYEDMGVLIEQKSRGIDLNKKSERSKKVGEETPYQQAKWYADNLPYSVRPRWIVVSNFDEFRIHDLDTDDPEHDYVTVTLDELPDQLHLFGFLSDKSASRLVKEKEISIKAGEIVGRLYKSLSAQYRNIETDKDEQRSLNILIVRFVFLLYAEDAGILQEHQAFLHYMQDVRPEDMRTALLQLFEVLDTPEGERDPYLPEKLAAFPYINGSLFAKESIIIPQFTQQIKDDLLKEASQEFDWSGISPTIFGAAFESTLNPETRRAGGMHYTSIENIHKVIDPLFLDDLKAELAEIEGERVEKTRNLKLRQFQNKLASIKILDPACGSGNFLTESYLSLRKLENRVLESLMGEQMGLGLTGEENPIKVNIDQFYGIEINDFAVAVAKTALWIAEEQTMDITQEILVIPLRFLPLTSNDNIIQANALRYNWNDLLPASECDYIIGNPPFLGHLSRSEDQSNELRDIWGKDNIGRLDYVSGWYKKAIDYCANNCEWAFVSTNSIAQGEPVPALFEPIFAAGWSIKFAYRTFIWNNEATDQAHVHVVIIGFTKKLTQPTLYIWQRDDKKWLKTHPNNINGYLLDAPNVFIEQRRSLLSPELKPVTMGNMPRGKELIVEADEYEQVASDPTAAKYLHPYLMGKEMINGKDRFCLWCEGITPHEISESPILSDRFQKVKDARLNSSAASTRAMAETPWLFGQRGFIPKNSYLGIPKVFSDRREYATCDYVNKDVIPGDKVYVCDDPDGLQFALISSKWFILWQKTVGGRLKSDPSFSNTIVWNNFPVPELSDTDRQIISSKGRDILEIRKRHAGKSLAELYDPDKMPSDLLAAHKALDKAVEDAYGVNFNGDEEKIVAHLFKLYADSKKLSGGE